MLSKDVHVIPDMVALYRRTGTLEENPNVNS